MEYEYSWTEPKWARSDRHVGLLSKKGRKM